MRVAILGSGNIGTDLLYKVRRSPVLELVGMAGIVEESPGLQRAAAMGIPTTDRGIDGLLEFAPLPEVVFDATSAAAHLASNARLAAAGIRAIDLTPAHLGPMVVPTVNLDAVGDVQNVNLVTCAGQATIPIVHALASVTPLDYAEVVATVASESVGPGTRANIDEFTFTTSEALVELGGARTAKAITILNPAVPPITMRNTVFGIAAGDADHAALRDAVAAAVTDLQRFVPGYRLRAPVQLDGHKITVFTDVEGAGDFLAPSAGNLDIMTAAAVEVAGAWAARTTSFAGAR